MSALRRAADPLDMQERLRAHAMNEVCFDLKTTQLMLFGMLLAEPSEAAPSHAIAARRVGASWAELQAVVALAALLRGLPAADLGAAALESIVKRESEDAAAAAVACYG